LNEDLQGLKPDHFVVPIGPAEAVPFLQSKLCRGSSGECKGSRTKSADGLAILFFWWRWLLG
jgi:hypothetical protein